MQKIMFNERYGLTAAVLQGRKTMTRRILTGVLPIIQELHVSDNVCEYKDPYTMKWNKCSSRHQPKYNIGEVVAIAQSYKDCGYDGDTKYGWCYDENEERTDVLYKDVPGWKNKMFVRSSRMPNRIRITDLKVERLQDISDEDCLKEGVFQWRDMEDCPKNSSEVMKSRYGFYGVWDAYGTPRDAFAALIDKVSGRGTWDKNPWVFAYTYELVK